MGNQQTQQLQMRQSSMMTQVLLGNEEEVIKHLKEQQIELNRAINQMGDRIAHYAAYKSMYRLMQWLILNEANFETVYNHRRLSPIDVAVPETRQWIYKKVQEFKIIKANRSIKKQTPIKNVSVSPQPIEKQKSSEILKRQLTEKKSQINEKTISQNQQRSMLQKTQTIDKRQVSSKKDSLDYANILFGQVN